MQSLTDHTESKDALTGLCDRSLLRQLDGEFASRKYPWTLLIIDVDHFKLVNDIYGHLTGDDILAHVGQTIRINLKKSDHALRFGGDEFLVVLPEPTATVPSTWPSVFYTNLATVISPEG